MISSISKDKIPNDFSFVLKTSILEKILTDNKIETDVTLIYTKPDLLGSIFKVFFWLPNENVNYHRLYITAGALVNKDAQIAREGLLNEVLPQFVKWIKSIEQLEKSSSKYKERYFNATYKNNTIIIEKD